MDREEIIKIVKEHVMTPGMVLEELGISRAALSGLKNRGILVPLIDGVYLREDVMSRKAEQKGLQAKYAEGSKFLQMLQKRVDPRITAVKKLRGQTSEELWAQYDQLQAEGWEVFHEPQGFVGGRGGMIMIVVKK